PVALDVLDAPLPVLAAEAPVPPLALALVEACPPAPTRPPVSPVAQAASGTITRSAKRRGLRMSGTCIISPAASTPFAAPTPEPTRPCTELEAATTPPPLPN